MFLTNLKKFIKSKKESIIFILIGIAWLAIMPFLFNKIVYFLNYEEIQYRDDLIAQHIDKITVAGTGKMLVDENLRKFGGYSGNRFVVFRESKMIKTSLTPVQVLDWYTKQLLKNGWQPIKNEWEPVADYNKFLQYAKDHNEQEQNEYLIDKIVKMSFYKEQHLFIIWLANKHLYYEIKPKENINCIYNIRITQTDDFQMPVPEHLKEDKQ